MAKKDRFYNPVFKTDSNVGRKFLCEEKRALPLIEWVD